MTETIHIIEDPNNAPIELVYPEALPAEDPDRIQLDLTNTPLKLYYPSVDHLNGEQFTLIRRDGFGGSDTGLLLNVNPFQSLAEIIDQKARRSLTEEEKAVGEQLAVIKGNDLEPLIIHKFEKTFGMKTLKPSDMYVYKDFPWLKMNFDGVTGTPKQYIPVEIKVVTKRGERHYNPGLCYYTEETGYHKMPENFSINPNNSVITKAAQYGIPPYYYTQLQDEIMALNAPFGYLCTLWESVWKIHVYFVYADPHTQNAIKIEGFKAWEQVMALRRKRGLPERLFNSEDSPAESEPVASETGEFITIPGNLGTDQ